MINRCLCYEVYFSELKQIADEKNAKTIEELQQHIDFGLNCKMCVSYVEEMLKTGKVEFN